MTISPVIQAVSFREISQMKVNSILVPPQMRLSFVT